MLKKLTGNQQLTLPIKLYPLKRHFIWFIMLFALLALLMGYLTFHPIPFDPMNNHSLPIPVQRILHPVLTLVLLWAIWGFYNILRSHEPMLVLDYDKLTVNNLSNQTNTDYYWQDIKEITFNYGKTAGMYVYLKDQPVLSKPEKLGLQMNYVYDDGEHRQTINNRELTNIINQLHIINQRHAKPTDEPDVFGRVRADTLPIFFHKVKIKFSDAL